MKSLRFLPLTFLAGVHGFAMFAAYAAVCLIVVYVIQRRRRLILVPVRSTRLDAPLALSPKAL